MGEEEARELLASRTERLNVSIGHRGKIRRVVLDRRTRDEIRGRASSMFVKTRCNSTGLKPFVSANCF